jgi:hypothetical protein
MAEFRIFVQFLGGMGCLSARHVSRAFGVRQVAEILQPAVVVLFSPPFPSPADA